MPLIPADIKNINFTQKDLFLDVKLETITINQGGLLEDFTGRPTFNVGFFRNSAGFGITNVKISTNASLQPTVDIEFKDLYGKTVFAESAQEGIDYKSLFQWPPPKFKFTFKGYLGQPVTWMLNMKTTSTQFNSDDGSYTIRATFIPNQWGMFADMPFLYLFAVKKLKADNLGSALGPDATNEELQKFQKDTESIIDLMYVGKKIEVVKKKKTKNLEKVISSLNLIKRDPITGIVGGTFKNGDEITEITPENNNTIQKFTRIPISLPDEYKDLSEEEIKDKIKSISNTLRPVENIRIKLAILNGLGQGNALLGFNIQEPNPDVINQKKGFAKNLDGIVDKNLELLDELIKSQIYEENGDELRKLTIKEVFSRIAGDAAYMLGYMLDAGEQGYYNNQEKRDEKEKSGDIIGRYFPMKWKTEQSQGNPPEKINSQVPAKGDCGIENFELKFINEFIVAISQGISQNRALQAQNFDNDEDKITHRVSNMEIISSNPFRNIFDWKEIASIIMKRAGIAGYVTQGSLVNAPGDSSNVAARNYSADNMRKLGGADVTNIDDAILSKLQPEDLESLKEFCSFWINFLDDPDGFKTRGRPFGREVGFKGGNPTLPTADTDSTGAVNGFINSIVVVTSKGNASVAADAGTQSLIELVNNPDKTLDEIGKELKLKVDTNNGTFNNTPNSLAAGFKAYTVEEYLSQFIGPRYLFFGRSTNLAIAKANFSFPTLQSTFNFFDSLSYITNFNNLTFIHNPEIAGDKYQFLVFEDAQDIQKLREFQPGSNEGDSELTKVEEDKKENEAIDDEPKNIIFIDDTKTVIDVNSNKSTDTPEFKWYEDRKRTAGRFISYNWCKSRNSLASTVTGITVTSSIDVGNPPEKIREVNRKGRLTEGYDFKANITNTGLADSTDEAGIRTINVAKKSIAIVMYAQNWNSDKECPTGGFFGKSACARATRVFLREYCKGLNEKIESLQDETSKIFGQILGKAGEHEDLLYQQMHNLFHQWQILALNDSNQRVNKKNEPSKLTPKVAIELESKFSRNEDTSFENPNNNLETNEPGDYSSGFIYSYPLQSRGNEDYKFIRISESLINIEPLYNAKANTTVLNVLQQLCSKNNFMFFPIAGNSGFLKIENLFEPSFTINAAKISNSFQILFHPTPESRVLVGDNEPIDSKFKDNIENFSVNAFPVAFGDPTNKIIKSIIVGTDDNKVTAESIVNLQRIVDNEDSNRTVTTDCSLLSVFEGRSYKAKLSTLGNAQISPMQFFFLKNHAIFTGLYQIMKVDHNITPNDMTTEFEGIKMRYASAGYGGVLPITLDDYRKAVTIVKNAPLESEGELGGDVAVERASLGESINEDGSISDGTTSPNQGIIINQGSPVVQDGIQFIDLGAGNYLNHQWAGPLKGAGKPPGPRAGQTANFPTGTVDSIVIHWTGGWRYSGPKFTTLKGNGLHYHIMIAQNGEVYQISDLKKYAWHAGGSANYSSIGISFVGGIINTGRKVNGKNVVDAYQRTLEEWNSTEYKARGNDTVYNPKQQFAGIIQACILAKRAHPSIKFITGHHWVTTGKGDPGDSFPWEILLGKLRQADSSFNVVEIATPTTGLINQPKWLKGFKTQPKKLQASPGSPFPNIDVSVRIP